MNVINTMKLVIIGGTGLIGSKRLGEICFKDWLGQGALQA